MRRTSNLIRLVTISEEDAVDIKPFEIGLTCGQSMACAIREGCKPVAGSDDAATRVTAFPTEARRLQFEARRLAVETFVKLHVEQVSASRQLLVTHLRLMFTLSLGSLAGVITLYAAALRFGSASAASAPQPWPTILSGVLALGLLVLSALLSAHALQRAARAAAAVLTNPFPDAERELHNLFHDHDGDENDILARTIDILERRLAAETVVSPNSTLNVSLMIVGIACSAAPLLL